MSTTAAFLNDTGGQSANQTNFNTVDMAVVVGYFVVIMATGFYAMLSSNRDSVSGYFLAGRFMSWMPVGSSIFASNIGSEHFVGLAGSGADIGIGFGAFELNAILILQMTGWIFLPVFISSRVCTLPEYMKKRFGGNRIRIYLAFLSLILYVLTKISVNLLSGAIFIQQALEWDIYVSVIILLAMTALCTIGGGLTAVIYTDTLQCVIMLLGATMVAIVSFIKIGGYQGLRNQYMISYVDRSNLNESFANCSMPHDDSFQLLRSIDDPDMPWLGFIFGQTPASIWYWCADQMIVQRLLAAKSLTHAQGGTLFAGYLKILPLFFIIIPGMISRVLFTEEIACVDHDKCIKHCQNGSGCFNIAYPKLVLSLLPQGLRGLMMSVMLAALMSDLTSIFNSSSTLFTCDIWPMIRKKPTVNELMIVGRSFVLVMVVFSLMWIPMVQLMQGGQLFTYIQSITASMAPPIAAIYILAVLWARLNERGAFWSLIIGFLIGVSRFVLDALYIKPACGHTDSRPEFIKTIQIHYMYFGVFLFWSTILIASIISYLTPPPEEYKLIRTTYCTRFSEGEREDDIENLELKVADDENSHESNKNISDEAVGNTKKNHENQSKLKKFFMWFCGVSDTPPDDKKEEQIYEHLANIAFIHQTRTEKSVLRICLLFIISIAITIFCYFSLPIDEQFPKD